MWKKIISDLMASGLSQREIAEAVNASQPHISDLHSGKRGQRIGYDLGKKLESLHAERCGKGQAA